MLYLLNRMKYICVASYAIKSWVVVYTSVINFVTVATVLHVWCQVGNIIWSS
jgi:hypothetical protein